MNWFLVVDQWPHHHCTRCSLPCSPCSTRHKQMDGTLELQSMDAQDEFHDTGDNIQEGQEDREDKFRHEKEKDEANHDKHLEIREVQETQGEHVH